MNPDNTKNSREEYSRKPLIPVLIDLSDKTALVIAGNGPEEKQAAKYLRVLSPGVKDLRVLAQCPSEDLRTLILGCGIHLLEKSYERQDLYGADLVICATSDQSVTDDVFATCRTLGIRLQILSQPRRSDYILQV